MEPQRVGTVNSRCVTGVQCRHRIVRTNHRYDYDGGLVEALRRGQPGAAEQLITRYGDRAYGLAIGITGSGQDAEEAVQDAFWAAIRKIDTFRGDAAFGSWLYRIVANAAYQKVRCGRRDRGHLSLDELLPSLDGSGRRFAPMADWSGRVQDPAIQAELREALTSAIAELPAIYRGVLVLRDVDGGSNREVAEVLGVSANLVKTRVHRARLFLRKRLGQFMTAMATPMPHAS